MIGTWGGLLDVSVVACFKVFRHFLEWNVELLRRTLVNLVCFLVRFEIRYLQHDCW
jgi:hypothetical protein